MAQSNITFVLFSFNEEKRIAYTVRNLIKFGEVLILDDGSTDKTGEIAQSLGARFVRRPKNDKGFTETPEMLEFVKSLAATPWIYWGFVDNILPKTLLLKLKEISEQDKIKYVYIPIHTYLWGDTKRPMLKASYPCFFRKEYVDFTGNKMHGMGKFTGSKEGILHLPTSRDYAMRHFSLYDLNKFISGHLKYAEAEAREKFAEGRRYSKFYMLGSMAHYFYLFIKHSYRSKDRGLFVPLLYSAFRLMVAVKLYEIEHNLNLDTIEAEFAKEKQKIVQEVEG